MKRFKNGSARLSQAERDLLVEALRRRYQFSSGNIEITLQWTGLGRLTTYISALDAGLMKRSNHLSQWYQLTDLGARIVSYWIGAGYTLERIEIGSLPSVLLPKEIL